MLNAVRKEIENLRVVPLDATQLSLSKSSGLQMGERKLVGQSATDLCNIFKLQYGALSVGKKEESDLAQQWRQFSSAVAKFRNRQELVAVIDREDDTVKRVLIPEKSDGNRLNFDSQLDFIDAYLSEKKDTTLNRCYFDIDKLTISALLIDETTNVRVGAKDFWKTGIGLNLGQKNGWYSPSFLRMICTNGMTSVEQSAKRWLVGVGALVRRQLRLRDRELASMVVANSKRLMDTPATVGEMQSVRSLVNLEKFDRKFNTSKINAAYLKSEHLELDDIFSQPSTWKDLASTGVPAYDIFNYATDMASHNDNLEVADRTALNVVASNLFFKGPRPRSVPTNPFAGH
jgi:hypothetical protein